MAGGIRTGAVRQAPHPKQSSWAQAYEVRDTNMGKRLYVGNLAYSTMDQQLQDAFGEFGDLVSATVVIDRATGQSRGFGFEFQMEG